MTCTIILARHGGDTQPGWPRLLSGRSRLIGIVITVVLLAVLAWKIDLHEFSVALANANYAWALPAVLTTTISYLLRTIRWGRIVRPIRQLSFSTLLPVLFIGFMANNLLPARMGEVVRAYALNRKTGLSKTVGLATILLERLCDGVTLVLALGAVALVFPLPAGLEQAGVVAGALFIGISVASIVVLAREDHAVRLVNLVVRRLPARIRQRVDGKAESFLVGLGAMRRGPDLLAVGAWSLVIWAVEVTTYILVLQSVQPHLATGTPLMAAVLLMVAVNLGTLIPSTPGYIGAFQFFGVLALSAFGVPAGEALAVAIVAHVAQWATVTGIGLFFVAHQSIGLGSLTAADDAVDRRVLATSRVDE
jgi:uncharacterized protein (TIRG00374 family)